MCYAISRNEWTEEYPCGWESAVEGIYCLGALLILYLLISMGYVV